jgi:hypothetical protein
MSCQAGRADSIAGGVFLIGLGLLFATRFWWPGILFLVAIVALLEGWIGGKGWPAIQGGLWMVFIALWAMFHFSLAFLFVGLGIGMLVGALARPLLYAKPKPYVDHLLD